MEYPEDHIIMPLGPAAAAILASCFGCFVIGIATILTAMFPEIKASLTWWKSVGAISGESGIGMISWLVSWLSLHLYWKEHEPNFVLVSLGAFVLLAVGLIALFPPVYQSFIVPT